MNQVFYHWTTSPWWFWKDSNPHSKIRSFMCSPLHHKTICCPPRIRTSILWTKTRCTAVIREDNLCGSSRTRTYELEEAWFTVKCSCRCAILPFARPKGLEPLTPGFGDQYSTNWATDMCRGRCRIWTYVNGFADRHLNHSANRPWWPRRDSNPGLLH